MRKDVAAVSSLIVVFIVLLLVAANSFFLTSKYGNTLEELDDNVHWEFFHEQLLTTNKAKKLYGTGEAIDSFPHRFADHYGTGQTYGTYVAEVKFPFMMTGKRLALYIPYEFGSYRLYVNGELVLENGVVGKNKDEQVPRNAPTIEEIVLKQQKVYVVLQVSNFYANRGGVAQPVQIGEADMMLQRYNTSIILYFFMNGIIFVMSIFMLLLGVFNGRNKPTLLFAAFSLVIAVRSIFARPYIYSITIFNVPWEPAVRIEMICTMVSTALLISLCYHLFAKYLSNKVLWAVYGTGAIQLIITISTEPLVFQKTFIYFYWVPLIAYIYIAVVAVLKWRELTRSNLFQFIGVSIILFTACHDFIVYMNMLNRPILVQLAVGIFVLLQVIVMSWQYSQKLLETVKLNREIMDLNASLDVKIQERTKELEHVNAELKVLATQDGLTGIANRHVFDAKLRVYFEETLMYNTPLSLILLDLDEFKKYNDHYGHTLGDLLLQMVVQTIQQVLPPNAIFARYGGEEFAIILPNTEKRVLVELGQQIVDVVAKQKFEHAAQNSGIVTVSVGGYTMTKEDDFIFTTQLIDAADEQLYLAKKYGKNMFVID